MTLSSPGSACVPPAFASPSTTIREDLMPTQRLAFFPAAVLSLVVCSSASVHASDVLAPDAKPRLVLEKGAGEGPAWHPERGLFFSGGNRITRLGKDGTTWIVVVSFSRAFAKSTIEAMTGQHGTTTYKRLEIDAETGVVRSMKMHQI